MINSELREGCVEAAVFGELTLADFQSIEATITRQLQVVAEMRVLLDLRGMQGLTLDAAIEDFRFARQHAHIGGRIAVITEYDLDSLAAWLEQALLAAEIRLFDDELLARTWLAGES